jgi:zinc transport system ATP-binding protein
MAIAKLDRVSYSYDGVPALVDVSLSVEAGDFLAVIGPNGSGKTTLLKVMLGLLRPDSGGVELFGVSVEKFRSWELVGYIPQNAAGVDPLFPASVEEVVSMALRVNRRSLERAGSFRRDAARLALRSVGMEGFLKVPLTRLSGGQQQRVFIARALVSEPRVLILDEPTTGIDAAAQNDFYEMLNRLNKEKGITIVLVTHEVAMLNRHVNRVACLNQRLIYHGSHEEFCCSQEFRDMLNRGDHLIGHRH